MSLSPLAYADSLRIGTIDFVSPDEIKVLIDIEAPDGVALNTGTPRPFPRINGYALIPSDEGHLVAQVEWITIERSQYPKRKGMQDFGLVDLPYPLRKMSLNPLGCLVYEGSGVDGKEIYRFRRGVESYPTVGDAVLLPTQSQLRAIVESGDNRRVLIGSSPLAANAKVMVDPDRLFGRHLAVLGNTGSGKSCSVAGLIRWSMDEARKARAGADPNARFIVLDPNGEYASTFRDMSKVRVYAVEPSEGIEQLQVPLWFWNSAEWSAFTQASAKAQRPTLVQALRSVRDGVFAAAVTPSHEMRRYLRTLVTAIQGEKNSGNPWKGAGQARGFRDRLIKWKEGLTEDAAFSAPESTVLGELTQHVTQLLSAHQGDWPAVFSREEVGALLGRVSLTHSAFGGSDTDILPIDADVPRQFTGDQLLRSLEATAELLGVSEYVETMQMRIRTILSDSRMKVVSGDAKDLTLDDWLRSYIGDDQASNGSVTVIDLSLVPAEVVHIITAVIARMTLEALQRYRKLHHGKTLPTVLVMEEAHTFIKRYKDDAENQNSAAICCQVFEKIAREGRKFGLGLVLSSQRPSELSPTVLSQCNSYLLHRISNDRDQELVHKLVPDNLRGLLRDLPSLPSRHAILLGWASELPVLVQMNALSEQHRPKSDDPDFWTVWSGQDGNGHTVERSVDWKAIADDWQQIGAPVQEQDLEKNDE
ncbi:ATP-binding protein [Pseudomonas aeruginosa]|uniref:ATP-binding protein n=1 Tax=Pseudomonas aeruginosa TaxID=287 RepID=UPI0018C808F4|nr:ATP-binding protein [Pseudomonas aeruginosa]ELK4798155.1 ATP-binding protein [Pseudomonas aeruginosa]ELK4827203.1 ATP-binding protein [Pseudomonas aeruginosa]ELK4862103.1 ATP-binding protein [Pseudomonas aeruginosa]MBG4530236.1 ATP-binding protein [Pseudomonas aeruginosa]MBI7752402.1 ATP-binding protein [Pseudomonas aeruginosa]